MFTDYEKVFVLNFSEIENRPFLCQKVDGNVLVLNFSGMENTVFFTKKLMEIYLLVAEKFLLWTFWECKNTVFFELKSWWKDDIHWLLKSPCFDLFDNLKIWSFLSQKGDGKIIFIWSFWVFHDIPGLGKYSFSCGLQFYLRRGPGTGVFLWILQNFWEHLWTATLDLRVKEYLKHKHHSTANEEKTRKLIKRLERREMKHGEGTKEPGISVRMVPKYKM